MRHYDLQAKANAQLQEAREEAAAAQQQVRDLQQEVSTLREKSDANSNVLREKIANLDGEAHERCCSGVRRRRQWLPVPQGPNLL